MAVNATMRPLKIPAKFVPYLEKHHIYDLFYEMTVALIKHRPEDAVQFLKNEMSRVRKRKGRLKKVVLIAPIHIDIKKFANALADDSTRVVTLQEILEEHSIKKQNSEPLYDPEQLAAATKKHVESKKFVSKGWILVDFPRTIDEAKALQRHCVLPTHTLELIHDPKDYSTFDLWNENTSQWSFESFHSMLVEYKRRAIELRRAYQSSYKRIVIRGRTFDKLVRNCKLLLRKMPHIGAPMLPRVVLIGARGSRRRTIANMLHQRFKLVHVHFWTLISKARASDDNLGEEIRHTAESININICLELLEARLLEDDCLNHGWVLTGFPNDETDFEALDCIDVPPNRVVFLNVSNNRCSERLRDRQINIYSGEVMSKEGTAHDERMKEQLVTHPDDAAYNVEIEQEVFSAEIQGMLDYCQHRAAIIKATGPLNEVFEKVESVIINPVMVEKSHHTVEISQSLYNQYQEDQSI